MAQSGRAINHSVTPVPHAGAEFSWREKSMAAVYLNSNESTAPVTPGRAGKG